MPMPPPPSVRVLIAIPNISKPECFFWKCSSGQTGTREAGELAQDIARTMSGYPAFWRKWAQTLAAGENGMESSLAVSFLAAWFDGNRISWGEVIRLGLSAATDGKAFGESPAILDHDISSETDGLPEEEDSDLPEFTFDAVGEENSGFFESEEQAADLVSESSEAEEFRKPSVLSGAFEEGELENDSREDEDGEGEESFSLRTMTMAGLLADQGDCRGALAIYKELWSEEPAGPRRGQAGRIDLRDGVQVGGNRFLGAGGKREAGSGKPGQRAWRRTPRTDSRGKRN